MNIILLVTDEWRYPTPENFNDPVFNAYWKELRGYQLLKKFGVEFDNHRTAGGACTPSRACLYTGLHTNYNGVDQTSGVAKLKGDSQLTYLDCKKIKNAGHYFRELNYDTIYIGKWHLSEEMDDETINDHGERIREIENKYLNANCLDKYGWDHWIGPEPHGADVRHGGYHCDPIYIERAKEWINNRNSDKPFILAINMVQPHDIVLYPKFKIDNNEVEDLEFDPPKLVLERPTFPVYASCPDFDARKYNFQLSSTINEDLSHKPSVQRHYKEIYENHMFLPGPIFHKVFSDPKEEIQYYYHCLKQADELIYEFVNFILNSKFRNSWFTLTADHGDLHEHGLRQKWHCAYDPVLKVPLIIAHPQFTKSSVNHTLTSSVDILPTLLEMTGARMNKHFHGDSILPLVMYPHLIDTERTSYYCTYDEITKGDTQTTLLAIVMNMNREFYRYRCLKGAIHLEALVYHHKDRLMKIVRYFNRNDPEVPNEWELYDLTNNPEETVNIRNYEELIYGLRLLSKESALSFYHPASLTMLSKL